MGLGILPGKERRVYVSTSQYKADKDTSMIQIQL